MACISLPTAMLVGTAVTGIGGLASALIGANAANTASQQQQATINTAIGATSDIYNQNKNLLTPFINAGSGVGVGGLTALLGGGDMDPAKVQSFMENLPGYKFTRDQGLKGVQNSYAANGLAESGAALKGAAEYATGLASTTYNSLFGNFLSLAQMGENAGGALAGVGSNYSSTLSNLLGSLGTAQASGTVGAANALTGGIGAATGAASSNLMTLGLYNGGFFNNGVGAANSNSLIPSNWSSAKGFY